MLPLLLAGCEDPSLPPPSAPALITRVDQARGTVQGLDDMVACALREAMAIDDGVTSAEVMAAQLLRRCREPYERYKYFSTIGGTPESRAAQRADFDRRAVEMFIPAVIELRAARRERRAPRPEQSTSAVAT